MKTCSKCGVAKELSEFYSRKGAKDGHAHECKACARARAAAWVKANSERQAASAAAYRAAHPKMKRKLKMVALREATERCCTACGQTKPVSEFARTSKARGRIPLAECRVCTAARTLAWQKANPSKKAAISARYYENNTAKIKLRQVGRKDAIRKKHTENPERYLAVSREWKKKNRDKCASGMREWKHNNQAYCTAQQQAREARKKNATPEWANQFFIEEIYELARLRTQAKTGGVAEWQVDHIVPLKSKVVCGLHCEANLQVIPAVVNRSKNNRHWPDMP